MQTFSEAYSHLNSKQQQAVDQTEGPVLVVAGPGTGKTQLLGVRAANIIASTDALPQNILCLTFTDSAVRTLKKRLAELIGERSYQVAVHTFHSFAGEILSTYREHVWNGAAFTLVDDIERLDILQSVLQTLPHNNTLSAKWEGKYVALSTLPSQIDVIKKSGLTPETLKTILTSQQEYCEAAEQHIVSKWPQRLSMKNIDELHVHIMQLPDQATEYILYPALPLENVLKTSFERAYEQALQLGKTGPISTWKQTYLTGTVANLQLKDRIQTEKWLDIAEVYEQYQSELHKRQLYDYSDMIIEAIRILQTNESVRADLQEQYHYIQADEFQDTNDAQATLLYLLADNPIHEGQPNLLVVGDDDQAIYKFQGADVGNIITFRKKYPLSTLIVLSENYRSHADVLEHARKLILQGAERLESLFDEISKDISQANSNITSSDIEHVVLDTPELEYQWVVEKIEAQRRAGINCRDIAVIARNHKDLKALSHYLLGKHIPVAYERRSNVLLYEPVALLVQLCRLVQAVFQGDAELASEITSHTLSHEMFDYSPSELWQFSLQAHDKRQSWIEFLENEPFVQWIQQVAKDSVHLPAEHVLDLLLGVDIENTSYEYKSPVKQYFFSADSLEKRPNEYMADLSGLQRLRENFRSSLEAQGCASPKLKDFIDFIDAHELSGVEIIDETPYVSANDAVQLLTVHKSKGMEFDCVFLLSVVEEIWQNKRGRSTSYPNYLPIKPPGDTDDDHLRLFYVAITRARTKLYLSAHTHDSSGKQRSVSPFLDGSLFEHFTPSALQIIDAIETSWKQFHPLPETAELRDVVADRLQKYELSVTHFNTFLDIIDKGPKEWFLTQLLRFPQAKSASGMYGTAVHSALEFAHTLPELDVDAVLKRLEQELQKQHFTETELKFFIKRGTDNLQQYLLQNAEHISPEHLTEVSISHEVEIGGARIGGKIDKIVVNEKDKTITVVDFKTGKQLADWSSRSLQNESKAWGYKNQLQFYKLLIERSRRWGGKYTVTLGKLVFVEPDKNGEFVTLDLDLQIADPEFEKLVVAVWQKMQTLELDAPSGSSMSDIYEYSDSLLS